MNKYFVIISKDGVVCMDCVLFLTRQSALMSMMEHSYDTSTWRIAVLVESEATE